MLGRKVGGGCRIDALAVSLTILHSSARNFMIYQRPDRGSMQQWADQVGDSSFTFDNMLPFFKKSVQFTGPNTSPGKRAANASAEFNAAAFSTGGPLQVSYANYAGPFSSYMEGALNEIGVASVQDFNSGSLLGAQYASSTIRPSDQSRDSSQTSFLNAASGRSNLNVYTGTTAKRIIFDSKKRATGVEVATLGFANYNINARREVIVSAGAFQSPQLLMVSGVGPATTLRQNGITVVADRPGVGQNMTDHIFFGPSYRVKVDTFTRLANDPIYVASQFLGPYLRQEGSLTNPVCDFLGWEKAPRSLISSASASTLSQFPDSWPEIEYLSAPGYVGSFSNLFTTQPKDGFQYASILAALVAPLSRGSVTITSKDTNTLPLINPNWLTDPTDQAVAVAAYKRVRQAFASNAMAAGLADTNEYFPGSSVQTDDDILGAIKDSLQTVWHASCTCRMGRANDTTAVVDSKTNVIGVTGLKVVDASSFALLPPGHPQSTVYALAEKVADQILRSL